MQALPPGNDNYDRRDLTGYDSLTEDQEQNDSSERWKSWISSFKEEHGNNCFSWLLKIFGVFNNSYLAAQKQQENLLINAIQNPQTFLESLYQLYQQFVDLQNQIKNLEDEKLRSTRNYYSFSQNNSYLREENRKLSNQVYKLQQENRIQVEQLQTRIEDLERQNEELSKARSSALEKLANRDRDKTSTITSNDSRRQRDVLTREFMQLNNQDFTAVSNEIFNYRCQSNSELIGNRKQEIARIKSVLSKRILKAGSDLISNIQSQQEDYFPSATQLLARGLLEGLQLPEKAQCPEPLLKKIENLVEKALKLVEEIVNDDPPGELLIEAEGTDFDPEKHEPVPGCEPSGKILYTTYPGYCVNGSIIGEALKAYVFTVPDELFRSVGSAAEKPQSQEAEIATNDEIHPQEFSGWVKVQGSGLCYRNSRKWEDKNEEIVHNSQFVNFDAWAEGEMVKYKDQESNIWFRVAGKELWLPKVYIHVN